MFMNVSYDYKINASKKAIIPALILLGFSIAIKACNSGTSSSIVSSPSFPTDPVPGASCTNITEGKFSIENSNSIMDIDNNNDFYL